MAASRRRVTLRSNLGDSWAVDESDSEESRPDEDLSLPPEQPVQRPSNSSQVSSNHAPSALRRRSSRASSAAPEPQLIMPSIRQGQVEGCWTSASRESESGMSPKKRTSKAFVSTSSSRSARDRRSSARADGQKLSHSSEYYDKEDTADKVISLLGHSANWSLDIIGSALKALRKPISWVIALYLFAGLLVMVQNILFQPIYAALSPVCRIPGMSMLGLRLCRARVPEEYQDLQSASVEFKQLMNVQGRFEELLDASAAGISLPFDMKRSESSVRDLRLRVRISDLNSKQQMMLELDSFVNGARTASYDLQRFNSHVGRGADMVLVTARWTRDVLDGLATKKSDRGLIAAFVHDKILAPFQPLDHTEGTVLNRYIHHAKSLSCEIKTLLAEAQALLQVLQNLEDHLDVIHGLAVEDGIQAQGQKDEVLSKLWTSLGGNRGALGEVDSRLDLLYQVGEYRKIAWSQISSTIMRLQAMGAELEALKHRVGSVELLKDDEGLPLEVHLESIRMGVERLEKVRETTKVLQKNYIDGILHPEAGYNSLLGVDG